MSLTFEPIVQVSDAVAMSEAIQEAARILRDTVEKGEELKGSKRA